MTHFLFSNVYNPVQIFFFEVEAMMVYRDTKMARFSDWGGSIR